MTIEEGLVARLLADDGVTALIAGRLHPYVIPEAKPEEMVVPAIVYGNAGEPEQELTHSGRIGIQQCNLQLACMAATPAEAGELAVAVRAALVGRQTWGTVRVFRVDIEHSGATYDEITGKMVVALNVTAWIRG